MDAGAKPGNQRASAARPFPLSPQRKAHHHCCGQRRNDLRSDVLIIGGSLIVTTSPTLHDPSTLLSAVGIHVFDYVLLACLAFASPVRGRYRCWRSVIPAVALPAHRYEMKPGITPVGTMYLGPFSGSPWTLNAGILAGFSPELTHTNMPGVVSLARARRILVGHFQPSCFPACRLRGGPSSPRLPPQPRYRPGAG